jgi:polysaccharide biosynthesis transport protein
MSDIDTNRSSGAVSLGRYLSLLGHWAWLVASTAILAGLSAYIISTIITPVYQANTTVMVYDLPTDNASELGSIQLNIQLSQTYSQMMVKAPVLAEVAKVMGLNEIDPESITAQPLSNMPLIYITAKASNPQQAAKIANTLVTVFRDQEQTLQKERFLRMENNLQLQIAITENLLKISNKQLPLATLDSDIALIKTKITNYQETHLNLLQNLERTQALEAESTSNIYQIEEALPPDEPISPLILENVVIAFLVGLIMAAGMVYIIGINESTLITPEEFKKRLELPVLGTISKFGKRNKLPIHEVDAEPQTSEAFRTLRTNIFFSATETTNPLQTIMVISPSAKEGKSTIAVNLGIAIAQNGHQVCLLDANLRQPEIHNLMKIPNEVGLSQALSSTELKLSIKNYLKSTIVKNLFVITSGEVPANPSELLGSKNFSNFLKVIKSSSDIVLIDTPPALPVTDALVLLPYVDGVLLVLKSGFSQSDLALQLITQLHRMNANILGIVVNNVNKNDYQDNYNSSVNRTRNLNIKDSREYKKVEKTIELNN